MHPSHLFVLSGGRKLKYSVQNVLLQLLAEVICVGRGKLPSSRHHPSLSCFKQNVFMVHGLSYDAESIRKTGKFQQQNVQSTKQLVQSVKLVETLMKMMKLVSFSFLFFFFFFLGEREKERKRERERCVCTVSNLLKRGVTLAV